MCKVLNAKQVGMRPTPDRVYVGRPSKWGNPFVTGRDGSRDEVIAKYRARIVRQPALMAALHELRGRDAGARPSAVSPTCSSNSQIREIRMMILHAGAARSGTRSVGACRLLLTTVPINDVSRSRALFSPLRTVSAAGVGGAQVAVCQPLDAPANANGATAVRS
jgi:hypothetical protein